MKGDFSKWNSDRRKNYRGVLQQQGRVLLDSDWNAQTGNMIDWQDQAAHDAIGPGVAAVPASTPNSFKVSGAKVDPSGEIKLDLLPGRVWADGLLTYLSGRYDHPGAVVRRNAEYFEAPIQDPPFTSGDVGKGTRDAVILEVWQEALNGFQVPNELIEPALGGPDTTERVHTASRFRLLRLEKGDTCHNIAGKLADPLSLKGRLSVSLMPTTEIGGDCPITRGGGYTGFEHSLYRIEIAALSGNILASKGPMFKWSRFNGGLVGRGRCHFDATRKKITLTANDQPIKTSGLTAFYLEIVEFDREHGYWHVTYGANVTLNGDDLDVIGDEVYYSEQSLPSGTVFFRLWNGIRQIHDFPRAVGGKKPVELRDGILLEFDPPAGTGTIPGGTNYTPGDYWTFSLRAGDIENVPAGMQEEEDAFGEAAYEKTAFKKTVTGKTAFEKMADVIGVAKERTRERRGPGSSPGPVETGGGAGASRFPGIMKRGEAKPGMGKPHLENSAVDKGGSKYLFSLDREYRSLLGDGRKVDKKIRKAFEEKGHPLSRGARARMVDEDHFEIPESTRTFHIRDDGTRLNITNFTPPQFSGKTPFSIKAPFVGKKMVSGKHAFPRIMHNRPPQGIVYHRVPLAILNWTRSKDISFEDDEISDCRSIFHPLAKQNICCSLTVGDGVSTFGDFDSLDDAVRHLPETGGEICLLPGLHRTNVMIRNRKHITIRGCGHRSKVIPGDAGWEVPVFRVKDCQFMTFENLEIDSIGGSAIVMEASEPGKLQGVEIRNNWIMSCRNAVHIIKGLDVNIHDNRIQMWDRADGGAAIYVSSEDVLIENNVISVIPPDTQPPEEEIPSDVKHPDPSDPCIDPSFIYGNLAYLTILVNFIWMTPMLHLIPLHPFRAPGGIHIGSGSERVQVIENEIMGGAGNGITLGSDPYMDKLLEASEAAPAPGLLNTIWVDGRKVKFMVRSEKNEPVSDVVFSLSKGGKNHERISSDGGFTASHLGEGESTLSVLSPNYRIKSIDSQTGSGISRTAGAEMIKKITLTKVSEEEEGQEEDGSGDVLDFLYDIRIYGNTISNMGLSGIGVPRVDLDRMSTPEAAAGIKRLSIASPPKRSLTMALGLKFGVIGGYVVNLSIQKNHISDCLKNPSIPGVAGELIGRGVGGISLGFCENVLIHENRIENNGVNHFNPVCGIFIFYGNQVDISHNFIIDNGSIPDDRSRLRQGMWGGIVMVFTTSLTRIPEFSQSRDMTTKGGHAARVHGNVVDQPVGRPLTVGALGPVSIVDNLFNSEMTPPGLLNTAVGGVLVVNMGGGFQKVMDFLESFRNIQSQQETIVTASIHPGVAAINPGVMMHAGGGISTGGGVSAGGVAGMSRGASKSASGGSSGGIAGVSRAVTSAGSSVGSSGGTSGGISGGGMEYTMRPDAKSVMAGGRSGGKSGNPGTRTAQPAAFTIVSSPQLTLQIERINYNIPNGNTLFMNNQTRLGPGNRSIVSQMLMTADDLGFSGNQSDIMSTTHRINTFLGGITLRAGDNRFKERIVAGEGSQKLSLLSMTKLMNNTHNNQGNHCIIATSLMEAINPYLGYRHSQGNQVLFPAKEQCPTIQSALSDHPMLLFQILTNLIGGMRK